MISGPPRRGRFRPGKTKSHQVQRIDESLNYPHRVVLGDIIIKRGRQKTVLPPVFPFDETAHAKAPQNTGKLYHK